MSDDKEVRHPDHERLERIGKDGTLRPLSIVDQWKKVADWHAFLESGRASEYPVLEGLNLAWGALEPMYRLNGKKIIKRGEALKNIANSPLTTFFYFIDMGFYPPPELLLTLSECWTSYEAGGGHTSLEQAFLGRSPQKSGNYAKRDRAKFKRMAMRWDFDDLVRKGSTRLEAAEAVSELFGGKPEPESILRMFRGKNFLPKGTAEK